MRSAIFESSDLSRSGARQRPQSSSPRLASTSGVTKGVGNSARKRAGTPNSMGRSANTFLLWNLEEMITSYQEHGVLPPILSPTLPSDTKYRDDDVNDLASLSQLTQENSNAPVKKPGLEKRPPKLSPEPKRQDSAKVRWVNKLNDPSKPRFLLRIGVPKNKLGLGIFVNGQKDQRLIPVNQSVSTPILTPGSTPISTPKVPTASDNKKRSKPEMKEATTELKRELKADSRHDSKPNKSRDDLIGLKSHWIKIAKETKFIADRTDGILSLVIAFDSLLLHYISYDYDERLKLKMKISPLEQYWRTIIDDATKLNERIDSNYFSDGKLNLYIKFFKALLHTFIAVLYRKINHIIDQAIADDNNNQDKITNLQKKSIANFKAIETNFYQSEVTCPEMNLFIQKNLPGTWSKRANNLTRINNQSYYLPINSYTKLNEFTHFVYSSIDEFIQIMHKSSDDDLYYTLKSGDGLKQL